MPVITMTTIINRQYLDTSQSQLLTRTQVQNTVECSFESKTAAKEEGKLPTGPAQVIAM